MVRWEDLLHHVVLPALECSGRGQPTDPLGSPSIEAPDQRPPVPGDRLPLTFALQLLVTVLQQQADAPPAPQRQQPGTGGGAAVEVLLALCEHLERRPSVAGAATAQLLRAVALLQPLAAAHLTLPHQVTSLRTRAAV